MRLPLLDPSGGDLKIAEVLIEYDGPQVFIARNVGRAVFLAMHALPDGKADRWLYVRVSNARARRVAKGVESLRRAFEEVEYGAPIVVRYEGDQIRINYYPDEVELLQLYPDVDSFLDVEDHEIDDLVAIKAHSVGELIPSIAQIVEAPLWETNPEIIAFFKANKTPAHVAARLTSRPVLDIAFSVGDDRIDYPVKNLGSALTSTQALFDVLSANNLPDRGPLPKATREQTRLLAIASYPSSFGLRIEAETGDLVGEGKIEIAIIQFLKILQTVGAERAFDQQIREIPRRAQRHLKSFISSIKRGKAAFSIEAGIPFEEESRRMRLSARDVAWLDERLNKTVDDIERVFTIEARLTGVSLKTKFFMLTDDDGAEYSGKIAKGALSKINEKRVNHLHKAEIEEQVIINEATGEENYKYVLLNISEID